MKKLIPSLVFLLITLSMKAPPIALNGLFEHRKWTPLQLSLFTNIQLFDEYPATVGLATGTFIYQRNNNYGIAVAPFVGYRDNYGIICNLGCDIDANFGLNIYAYGLTGPNYGLMLSVVSCNSSNHNTSISVINQIGMNHAVPIGGYNEITYNVAVPIGIYNQIRTNKGISVAFVNNTRNSDTNGGQIGILNISESDWQIGLINYNPNGIIPFTLFFNYTR